MPATRFLLIRHAHTHANAGGAHVPMCGWTDVPLSPEGERQVQALCNHLKRAPALEAIYSSPLRRASGTAAPLASSRSRPLRLCDALREIHCGEVDGVAVSEVQQRFSELWQANLRQEDPGFRWPGGESYTEFRSRSLETVRALAAEHAGRTVALVTHAGVINQIVGSIQGISPARWEPYRPRNSSVTEVLWEGESGVLVDFDDVRHLA